MRTAAERVTYEDLYARWERGGWRASEIELGQDRRDWLEGFSAFERRAALWSYALFFWGEDAVTDSLSPFIDAAPREEQKYFLATQQADEARHAVFFNRFMHEVVGLGDGTPASALAAVEPQLTWGFRRTFEHLARTVEALRRDSSPTQLAKAVAMYHLVVEATLAQPGQHFIVDYLSGRGLLPGFRTGMQHISRDEQRHVAFGVRLLADLAREDPEVPAAVAELLREATPLTSALFIPPGWDRRYTECLGFTVEQMFEAGVRSLEARLAAAGMPLSSLPGPAILPTELPPADRALRGVALLEARYLGPRDGPAARDAASMAMLMDSIRRGIDSAAAPRPMVLQWEFQDAEPWHVHVDNGATRAEPGREWSPDVTFRCRLDDWVDVMARRTDPRRSLLTGRIRPLGSPRALWALRRLFSA